MKEEKLQAFVKLLNENKNVLEKQDGHIIESICAGEGFDREGSKVRGISVKFANNEYTGTYALPLSVETIVHQKYEWFRFSPQGFFLYFS